MHLWDLHREDNWILVLYAVRHPIQGAGNEICFSHVFSGHETGQNRVVPSVQGNQLDAAKVVLLAGFSKFLHAIHVFATHWLKIRAPRPKKQVAQHQTKPVSDKCLGTNSGGNEHLFDDLMGKSEFKKGRATP